jgi:polysaccharide pyruvyl transferase WcaK-like protein
VVLSFDPAHTSNQYGVRAISNSPLSVAGKLPLLRKSDLFILGGGGLIQDYSSILNIPFWMSNLRLAHMAKTPIMLYGVGVEPIRFTYFRKLVSKVLDQVSLITVRDEESKRLLKSWGLSNEILTTADPAWGMKHLVGTTGVCSYESQANRKFDDGPVVGISLRQWLNLDFSIPEYFFPFKHNFSRTSNFSKSTSVERFLNTMARLADTLIERANAHIVVLPIWQKADRVISMSLVHRIRHKQQVHLVQDQFSALELIEIIQKMDVFVGMRLHSLLFAAISRTPFIALAYSPKIKAFMNQFRHFPRCEEDLFISVDNFEHEKSLNHAVDIVLELIERHEKIKRDIEVRTTELATRSLISAFHAIKLLGE